MLPSFPFTAIVGQDALRRALVLNVVQPALGGVLVRGGKGSAKSTAVRALAGLLPGVEAVAGCPFRRAPGEEVPDFPLPPDAPTVTVPTPLVELPIGATEDRVLGALHLERALRGERRFEPGLLAAANRGLLYIDEVNLLPDHLVDCLLDAAAGGVHRFEREGLSVCHPARFVLIGTMNPEEGELRPQLLDRFGLAVDARELTDAAERAEAVRRRLAFDADPDAFLAEWRPAEAAEAQRIADARRRLPCVRVGADVVRELTERCLAAGVEGLRADLTLARAAAARAAYQGREEVTTGDVDAVAELALAHRRKPTQAPPPPGGRPPEPPFRRPETNGNGPHPDEAPAPRGSGTPSATLTVFPADPPFAVTLRPEPRAAQVSGRGRRADAPQPRRGAGPVHLLPPHGELSWAATLRAAAGNHPAHPTALERSDLRGRARRGPAGGLLLLVLDASGSMATWRRMRQVKAAARALLLAAYRRRDRVAVLAFRGTAAELVWPPRPGLAPALAALEALPTGGTTPLAHGLAAAADLARTQRRREPGRPVWAAVFTDGRANVARGAGDPWADALAQARRWAADGFDGWLIDTQTSWPRLGRTAELAHALGLPCVPLEAVRHARIRRAV